MNKRVPHFFRRTLLHWSPLLVMVLGLPASLALAQDSVGLTDSEIFIGQSCQLTGPLAALSSEVRQGASLYFDHINASGGVRGRKIRVVALDDAYDPKKAAENTRKLIDEHKVLALFQYAGMSAPVEL